MRRVLIILSLLSVATVRSASSAPRLDPPILDTDGAIAGAALQAVDGLRWWSLDGHLHTDHSHDAGVVHQQNKRPENHDTEVGDQIGEVERQQLDVVTLTDHRTYDGAYDPAYRSTKLLLDGEEWGGYPHATAWGISEQLDQGADEQPVSVCGVARASHDVRAEDGIYGVAHPEDGRRPCIDVNTLAGVPIDHLEAFRYPHTGFYVRNIQAGHRLVPVTGSDNHFKQLYGTQGGPGASTTFILARALTKASLVEAVRAGRVISGTRAVGPRLTSFLDADRDGKFETITGGGSTPAGATVRVAFRIERGPGHWLEVLNDKEELLVQFPVAGVDTIYAYDLPATGSYLRAQLTDEPIQRVSGGFVHDYLAYEDSLRVLSAPLWLSPATPAENGTQGDAASLSGDAAFAGYADVARDGDAVDAVWQERRGPTYAIVHARSADGGVSWSLPEAITTEAEDARFPSVATTGARVSVAYERKSPGIHGGAVVVRASVDGVAFGDAEVVAPDGAARPAIAATGGTEHLAYMQMTPSGYTIRYAMRSGGSFAAPLQLSHGATREGPLNMYATIPHTVHHIPAAVHPTIASNGAQVVVAWEDNREDPTPLRNGTPDDWGIYAAVSNDGGTTFATDARISPRHDRSPVNEADPEKMEGNPARHVDLVYGDAGALYAAWQDRNAAGGFTILVARSADGATWGAPVAASASTSEFAYRPELASIAGGVRVVWQASAGAQWNLRTASSADDGATFSPETAFTTGTGYAGFPSVAGQVVLWTGESGGSYGVWTARVS